MQLTTPSIQFRRCARRHRRRRSHDLSGDRLRGAIVRCRSRWKSSPDPRGGFATTLLGTSVVVPAAHGNAAVDRPPVDRLHIDQPRRRRQRQRHGGACRHAGPVDRRACRKHHCAAEGRRGAGARPFRQHVDGRRRRHDQERASSRRRSRSSSTPCWRATGSASSATTTSSTGIRHHRCRSAAAVPGSGSAQAAAVLSPARALDPRGLTAIGASLVEAQDAAQRRAGRRGAALRQAGDRRAHRRHRDVAP